MPTTPNDKGTPRCLSLTQIEYTAVLEMQQRIAALEQQSILHRQLIEELLNQNKQLNDSLQLLYSKLK